VTVNQDSGYQKVDDKVCRRILNYGEQLMLVEYRFHQGGVGQPHKHEEHEQLGYIAQGSFELIVDGEKKIIRQGDSYYAPKNSVHGVIALEDDSVIIDAFTPLRTDLLK
jgi:quercetin dioxygenase-like cupin family protein